MRDVSIVGTGYLPVMKQNPSSLREMGADVVRQAMAEAGVDLVDGLFVSNYGGDELQGQKHLGPLIADEAGISGVEALQIRAACAAGAGALRMAWMTVASGQANLAAAVGVEKMDAQKSTPVLAKALDAEMETAQGNNMVTIIAKLMRMYFDRYDVPEGGFDNFPLLAHANGKDNPTALFYGKEVTAEKIRSAKKITDPVQLYDCSPICDGAAAVLIAPKEHAHKYTDSPVHILASAAATDRMRVSDRTDPLALEASSISAQKAYAMSGLSPNDIDFFEAHDAFSIMTCLSLEAAGFAARGEGWRMAQEQRIWPGSELPITTLGGLKARGHPIGATAFYQMVEIVKQLNGTAETNQLKSPEIALMQSIGGAASTLITHIFSN